jgi:hypothetical protein
LETLSHPTIFPDPDIFAFCPWIFLFIAHDCVSTSTQINYRSGVAMVSAEPIDVATVNCETNEDHESCNSDVFGTEASGNANVAPHRPKVPRRRQIDPTTCERDYSQDEIEFMQALDEYKRRNGRMFPTCSEILEVVRGLNYVKQPPILDPPVATNS